MPLPLVVIVCPREFRFTDATASVETPLLADVAAVKTVLLDFNAPIPAEVLAAHAIILWHGPLITAPVIAQLKNCRVIVRNGVGVDSVKSTIYGRLKRTDIEGPGVIHFPLALPREYFDQLTAEKQAVKMVNGHPKRYWTKKDGDRNEALDTMVYAYAALHYCYSRHNRASFWEQMQQRLSRLVSEPANHLESEQDAETQAPPAPVVPGRVNLSGWRRS
jgi:phage terminase large subunit GpA-like protein